MVESHNRLPRERAAALVGAVQYLAYDWPQSWGDNPPTAGEVIKRLRKVLEEQGFRQDEEGG